jgi:hypothetical protein
MDEWSEYLYDPVKHGVTLSRVSIKSVVAIIKALQLGNVGLDMLTSEKAFTHLDDATYAAFLYRFNWLVSKDCIKPEFVEMIRRWYCSNVENVEDEWFSIGADPKRQLWISKEDAFGPNIVMRELDDVIHIAESPTKASLVLDMVSVKKEGVRRYLELLRLLPFEPKLTILLNPSESHSSRFVFEPFSPALQTWLNLDSTQLQLPKNLQEYLAAAATYYNRCEWRTSIVLSAIIVESVLAEVFEEEFHKTPDIPLGAMHKRINKGLASTPKKNMLKKIETDLNRVNGCRIAAVHRGSKQLTQIDSMDCLRGATRTAIWRYF